MKSKYYQIKAFMKMLHKEKEANEDFLEGFVYWDSVNVNTDERNTALIRVCPLFRNIEHLPILYRIFENHGIQVLEDEFKTDGYNGYEQYHKLIIDYTHFRPKNMVENMMEDIICKQLD